MIRSTGAITDRLDQNSPGAGANRILVSAAESNSAAFSSNERKEEPNNVPISAAGAGAIASPSMSAADGAGPNPGASPNLGASPDEKNTKDLYNIDTRPRGRTRFGCG